MSLALCSSVERDRNPSPRSRFPFQERRRACSSAPYPKTQSAAAWGSSRSSSRWAATVCCCSSPRPQVPGRNTSFLLILWPLFASPLISSLSLSPPHFAGVFCVLVSPSPDFQSFYNILKNSRGHSSAHSAFSDRTEESSAVQYFQVRGST